MELFPLSLMLLLFIIPSVQPKIPISKGHEIYLKEIYQDPTRGLAIKYPERQHYVRRQKPFSKSTPFPCNNATKYTRGRSVIKPSSVHKLRPGDIDIIGAMGDSLVAGNGALEEWALGNMFEHRGISWCIGGEGTWRKYLTLPNILKEFNPSLIGFSKGTGEFLSRNSQLNVAFPVAADADALTQAKVLVKRIKQISGAKFNDNWKMITLLFGANDLCSGQCYDSKNNTPRNHAFKLMAALDYLEEHLPRTFVNLIPVLDVSVSVRIKRSFMCRLMHILYCACFHRSGSDPLSTITHMARNYQKAEEELVSSGRYDKTDNFTVVIQPFMKVFNAPIDPKRWNSQAIDISYITHDCFHFSQKGHALGANMLWNNLLQPVGKKSAQHLHHLMQPFICPTDETPYLFTYKNSQTFFSTGHQ